MQASLHRGRVRTCPAVSLEREVRSLKVLENSHIANAKSNIGRSLDLEWYHIFNFGVNCNGEMSEDGRARLSTNAESTSQA